VRRVLRIKKVLSFTALTIAMFIGILDSTIVNIALPDIMTYFHANLTDTSWISSIYVLALSAFMITSAKLADQYGRKKMMLLGLALFGISSLMCVFAPSLLTLVMIRFLQGVGGSIITPIVIPMGIEVFGKNKMPMVASIVGAVTALAAAGGPPLGGVLLKYYSWKMVFGVNVPLAALAFILTLIFIKESYDLTISKKIDLGGIVTLTIGLFGLSFGLLKGQEFGWQSPAIIWCFITSFVALTLFIFLEIKIKAPMLEFKLFKETTFTSSCLVYLITGFALVCPVLICNYYLQNVLGEHPLAAALIIMPVSLAVIFAMPIGNMLAQKIGSIPINVSGMLIIGASLYLMSLIRYDTPKSIMILFMIINGIGFGLSTHSIVSAIHYLPQSKSGIGSGVINASRQIGTCLGIALLITLLDSHIITAKQEIQENAIKIIDQKILSKPLQSAAKKDIYKIFNDEDSKQLKTNITKMKEDLTETAKQKKQIPKPRKETDLAKLYHGTDQLSVATATISDQTVLLNKEQMKLSSALADMNQDDLATAGAKLGKGSEQLKLGTAQIHKVLTAIKTNIALVAQKRELQQGMSQIKKDKNVKITQAFSRTYLFCSVLVVILSPIALFTDRDKWALKRKRNQLVQRKI
jgi:EmrB/QacA subfamily drug resistance transporter